MVIANISAESFALAVTLVLIVLSRFDRNKKTYSSRLISLILFVNALSLVSFIFTWVLEGKAQYETLDCIFTFLVNGLGFIMAGLYTEYIACAIGMKAKIPKWSFIVIEAVCVLAFLLNLISIFNGMYFSCPGAVYQRGPLFRGNQIFAALILIPDAIIILRHRKELGRRDTLSLLSYQVLPLLVALLRFSFFGLDMMCLATTLTAIIIYVTVYIERGWRIAAQEKELSEARVAVMLSQIQPHFLYNALLVIQDLCHDKAPEAEQATVEFSKFLRGNLDSLKADRPIPFQQELNHTKNYLALEKKRFGDRLHVDWDIQATDFSLPALSLQPLVENAVRYGVTKRTEGGNIKIRAQETEKDFIVSVTDDGVGYDINKPHEDGRTHVGIANVKSRLESMCGGTLRISSTPGIGTYVEISVPKGGELLR